MTSPKRLRWLLAAACAGMLGTPPAGAAEAAPGARFDQLVSSRDGDYEQRRRRFFASSDGVAYLPQRFGDPDRVVAFIARTLHAWATHPLPEYEAFDRFLEQGIYATEAAASKTAVGWRPEAELSGYLHAEGNRRSTQEYALLRALMRPSAPYLVGGINLYFYAHPVSEPQVLIRINLESPVPGSTEGLATLSLRQIDAAHALQALEDESARAVALRERFPEELDALRRSLAVAQALACTPAAPNDPDWHGIIIDAPALVKVGAGQNAFAPLCGLAVVPIIVPTPPEMLVVAVDNATGQRYIGPAVAQAPLDYSVPNPVPRRLQPHEVAGMTGQLRFETDLMTALGLPRRDADYRVHIERGTLSSNVVRVRVRVAE
ncbi:MAG: hypothetical protein LBE61_19165 [Burkholderiaceae bacterium]|nr:hypothetical protein [Burkholderiaceae bacterium]